MLPLTEVGTVLMAVLVLYIVYCLYRLRGLPPGPLGLPLIGYLHKLDPKNPHLSLTQLARTHGPIYSLQMGKVFTVVLTDVRLIREAFSSDDFSGRAPLYLTHGIMNGNGIICTEGEKWRDQRKFIVSNLRNFGMVKSGPKREKMEVGILEGVKTLMATLEESKVAVDTEKLLMHHLGNVVSKLVFGVAWKEDDETWLKLQHLQEEGTKLIGVAGPINFLPFLRFIPRYNRSMKWILQGIRWTHDIYRDLMAVSLQDEATSKDHMMGEFLKEQRVRGDNPGFYTTTQACFLLADIFGAGVDTTMTTLRWFYLFMAANPKIQERVQNEIDEVVGSDKCSLSYFGKLPYLEACIYETQRIRSVTPLGIPHGTVRDTSLGGFRIPQGTMVVPLQWAIHMSPDNFKDPGTFEPSRFLGEEGQIIKPEGFIPFQIGKRICLGEEYAKMLLFSFTGALLQRFQLTLPEEQTTDLEGEVGLTFTPKKHKIKFVVRE